MGFEQLFDEYYDKVFVYIARRVNNSKDAEDLTANVFMKAFKKPFDPKLAKFSTYIYAIAGNELKNYYRSAELYRKTFNYDELDGDISEMPDLLGDLITKEEYSKLCKSLSALPARQYEAIYRRYYLEQPFKEIGAALAISEDAAKKLHNRAVDALKRIFEKS